MAFELQIPKSKKEREANERTNKQILTGLGFLGTFLAGWWVRSAIADVATPKDR